MIKIWFHEDLWIFLSNHSQDGWFESSHSGHETVKHKIESYGIPHTEVDVILTNGTPVNFTYRPENGDIIQIYSEFEEGVVNPNFRLKPNYVGTPKFSLDGHLGTLSRYLRLLGMDSSYKNEISDDLLVTTAVEEDRIILTRDRGLLMRSNVHFGYYVREINPKKQVKEVINRFNLQPYVQPFSRCANCNGFLKPVSKLTVLDRLEPKTKLFYDDFRICNQCDQIYWRGSHFIRMEKFITGLLED